MHDAWSRSLKKGEKISPQVSITKNSNPLHQFSYVAIYIQENKREILYLIHDISVLSMYLHISKLEFILKQQNLSFPHVAGKKESIFFIKISLFLCIIILRLVFLTFIKSMLTNVDNDQSDDIFKIKCKYMII